MLAEVNGPVVWGVPTGHTADAPMCTVPLGVEVTVGTDGGTARVVVEEAAVA